MSARRSRVDEWMRDAGCRDEPPERFTDPAGPNDTYAALMTCQNCAVRAQCLNTALNHSAQADVGVWGGTTEATRHRIRAGELSADDILQGSVLEPHRVVPRAAQATSVSSERCEAHPLPEPEPAVPRLPAPEITLGRDAHGDYVDATGRVIVFRIHGDPPYMLMIDDHCVQRTHTVTEARQLAWNVLNGSDLPSPRTVARRSTRHVR